MNDIQAPDQTESADVRRLRTEAGTLRRRLDQRERLIADLNRRLLSLERGAATEQAEAMVATSARLREVQEELGELRADRDRLAAEVERIYSTKLFRLFGPARRAYGRLRGVM